MFAGWACFTGDAILFRRELTCCAVLANTVATYKGTWAADATVAFRSSAASLALGTTGARLARFAHALADAILVFGHGAGST
jgi:hypothetical protein